MIILLIVLFLFNMAIIFIGDGTENILNENKYRKMPELNVYNDYRSCVAAYKDNFRYCVTHVYIQANQSSELWNYIDEFSSYTYQHYRHDILKRGICMNDCAATVRTLRLPLDFKLNDTKIYQPYPTRIAEEIPELSWTVEDYALANACNNLELEQTFGLQSVSKISFCLSTESNKIRQAGDKTDHLFMAVSSALFGLVMIATISEYINYGQPTDSFFLKFISSFDARRNLLKLNKPSSSFTFTSMKLAGLAMIGCSHAFTALNMFSMVDTFKMEDSVHRDSAVRIRGWQIFLPTLFLISGYFMSFSWIGQLMRGERVPTIKDAFRAVVQRVVRFFPSMAFMVFFFATRFYNWFSEPKWLEVVANERISCRENGWANLFFLSNVVHSRDACVSQAWSIPAQVQLFLIGQVLLLILNRYPKHIIHILSGALLFSNVLSIIIAYLFNIHGLILGVEPLRNHRYYDDNYHYGFVNPLTYLTGWIWGMLLAALYHKLKQKNLNIFTKYQQTVSCGIILGVMVCAITATVLINKIFNTKGEFGLNFWMLAIISLTRNVVIIPCLTILNFKEVNVKKSSSSDENFSKSVTKSETFINKYLFWFHPLAKLGYSMYCSHFFVVYLVIGKYINQGARAGTEMNLLVYFLEVILFSIASGVLMKLAVEQPFYNLWKLFCSWVRRTKKNKA